MVPDQATFMGMTPHQFQQLTQEQQLAMSNMMMQGMNMNGSGLTMQQFQQLTPE